jgi:hypothetical protein
MSKISSHGPFGHLKHKLGAKEGPGVKLTIWLPTTKRRESTRPRCVQGECDTPLKSSQGELQVCFRPRPNRRSKQRVMTSWSPGSPNRENFETIGGLGNPRTKSHSGVGAAEWWRKYYMGEGGGFPRVWAVVSQMSPCCLWFVPTPRVVSKVY